MKRSITVLPVLVGSAAALIALAGCTSTTTPAPTATVTEIATPAPAASGSASTPSASASASDPAGGSGGSSGGSASGTGCATSQLQGGMAQGSGGAAGSVYLDLTLTNSGSSPCTLQGWPGLSFVGNNNGSQLGVPAEQDRTTYPHDTVTLQPQGTAYIPVKIAQAANFGNDVCNPQPADGFRVYPPGQTASLYIPYRVQACDSQQVQMTVSAVQATNVG